MKSGPDHFTGSNQIKMAEATSNIQSKSTKMSDSNCNSLPLEDVMDLIDSGFFDCDEEILQQVNSLETDVSILFLFLKMSTR